MILLVGICQDVQAEPCAHWNAHQYGVEPSGHYRWRLDTSQLPSGWTATQAASAFLVAAEEWNNAGAGKTFTYDGLIPAGLSAVGVTPDLLSSCPGSQPDCCAYSVVYFDSTPSAALASAGTFYCNNGSGATQFRIRVNLYNAQGASNNWVFDRGSSSSGRDLVSTLAHEFGHVSGLGHDTNHGDGVAALMQPNSAGQEMRRHLGGWELTCMADELPRRALAPRSRLQVWNAISAQFSTYGASLSAVSQGALFHSPFGPGDFSFDSAFVTSTPRVRRNQTTSGGGSTVTVTTLDPDVDVAGLQLATFRHIPSLAWLLVNDGEDWFWTDSAVHAEVPVRRSAFVVSTNDFATASASTSLEYCNSQFLGGSCAPLAPRLPVLPNGRVAVAWDPVQAVSLVGWASARSWDYGDIYISAGPSTLPGVSTLLPKPTIDTTMLALASPGIACSDAGTWNCLIVYTPTNSVSLAVHSRPFRVMHSDTGTLPFYAAFDPSVSATPVHASATTASAPAVWYNDGHFWLAIRSSGAGQPLRIFRSATGSTWSAYLTQHNATVVAPSAPAYLDQGAQWLTYAFPLTP